ncbi:hypothetical protein NLU66_02660 [Brachybacterium sp. NBEC-018]|uniref:hypothetical protein n=1 Tax=Brachybacterium sp. NBEC-018 TaxID=2996004 RepID=UPI0021754E17|nr:hypothetical protein [Brachybacterium sp. NBEC-018]UVY84521.1 hypothetical protein NLU66_02660 [Brachybacterium sp. NBEC-018]
MTSTRRSDEPVDARERRRHGRWSLRLEGDEISEIALDGVVLVETLRPAVRDRDWDTVPPQVLRESWSHRGELLVRELEVAYTGADGAARATTVLEIDPGSVRVRFTLEAEPALVTNRVGLTVMLPRAMAGDDATARTPDGQERRFRFPRTVSPWQPLFDIRSLDLSHRDVRALLQLDGDVFEMEDQRNWTDASYKIYSRPLVLPFPYRVEAGERVVQEVELTATSPAPAATRDFAVGPTTAAAVDLAALLEGAPVVRMPRLGVGATTAASPAGAGQLSALTGLDHLLVEASDRFDVPAVLRAAAAEAAATGLPADLWVIGTERTDLPAVLTAAAAAGLPLRRVSLVDESRHVTTRALARTLAAALASTGLEPVLAARSHFTELNREHAELPADLPLLAFPSTPQMHQQETWHAVEAIGALADVLGSARTLHPDARLLLGPVTLRPRVNAVATRAELVDRDDATGHGAHHVPGSVDPRQGTAWAGAWLAAVVAVAAAQGVEQLTLMEAAGPRGVLGDDGPTPAGEAITLLAGLAGQQLRVLPELTGPGTAAIAHEHGLVLVNARLEPLSATLPEGGGTVTLPPGSLTATG